MPAKEDSRTPISLEASAAYHVSDKNQCDAKPEGCTPCARTGRKCPGYRRQVDLMFRDQSSNVIKKAQAAEVRKSESPNADPPNPAVPSTPSTEVSPQSSDSHGEHEVVAQRWDSMFSLGPTVDERATCHFVFHYLVGVQAPSRGVLDNLLLLYQSNSVDDNLLTAVKAISYASYSHHMQNKHLTDVSRYHYTRAVNLTNAALRAEEHAVKDSTLMSVMILGMYEILTGNTQRSLRAWMQHIRGSSALVKMRGEEQLKTAQGRQLLIQASVGILTSCVQLNLPVPRTLTEMLKKYPQYRETTDDFIQTSFSIHRDMIEVNQFRAAVNKGKISDPLDIISTALHLDGKLRAIGDSPTPEFQYYVLHTDPQSEIAFKGTYHVYFDLLVANLWNSMRSFRILLHEQIRDVLLGGFTSKPPKFTDAEYSRQFQRSTDICFTLQAEILASVPQHLGYVSTSMHNNFTPSVWGDGYLHSSTKDGPGMPTCKMLLPMARKATREHGKPQGSPGDSQNTEIPAAFELKDVPDIRASGGYNLIWPLWLTGVMNVVTEEVRQYASRNLRRIGKEMGIQQACMLAEVIDSKEDIEVWKDGSKYEVVDDG